MRLTHKLAKLLEPDAYRSIWRGIGRALYPQPVGKFLERIDRPALAALAERHRALAPTDVQWPKYFDAERWLRLNIRRAQDIGLDRGDRNLRILDLGSGAGYFLLVARELGHEGMGLDIGEPAFYGDIFDLFGLKRVVWRIEPRQPLPEFQMGGTDGAGGARFDLVTAFSIAFNGHKSERLWGPAEWGFFLDDLRDRFLTPGGRIYLDMNPERDGSFMTPELREYFVSRGARVDRRSKLMFDPLR